MTEARTPWVNDRLKALQDKLTAQRHAAPTVSSCLSASKGAEPVPKEKPKTPSPAAPVSPQTRQTRLESEMQLIQQTVAAEAEHRRAQLYGAAPVRVVVAAPEPPMSDSERKEKELELIRQTVAAEAELRRRQISDNREMFLQLQAAQPAQLAGQSAGQTEGAFQNQLLRDRLSAGQPPPPQGPPAPLMSDQERKDAELWLIHQTVAQEAAQRQQQVNSSPLQMPHAASPVTSPLAAPRITSSQPAHRQAVRSPQEHWSAQAQVGCAQLC